MMDVFTQFIKNPIPYEWEAGTKNRTEKQENGMILAKFCDIWAKKEWRGFICEGLISENISYGVRI